MEPYIIVYGIISAALIFFIFSSWRYELIALIALLLLSILGIISPSDAFIGFANPAIWTIVGILIISKGLINSGLINVISRKLDFIGKKTGTQVGVLSFITGILSGFINNIGALTSLIPVTRNLTKGKKNNISKILMPLAFSSLLGGMVTLIGTPSNIIIALFRAEVSGQPFRVFDFFPVGFGVAFAGITFISLIGWRLVPKRKSPLEEEPEVKNYKAEIIIEGKSITELKTLEEILTATKANVKIDSIIHEGRLLNKPPKKTQLQNGDILIAKGSADEISKLVDIGRLKYANSKKLRLFSEKDTTIEAVLSAKSPLINKKLETTFSHKKYDVTILSVAHYEKKKTDRVLKTVLKEGDILVFQGDEFDINKAMNELNCQPLKERSIRIGQFPRLIPAISIFVSAILLASFGILSVEIAFMIGAVFMILTRLTTIRESYSTTIDWSIIVLIGAMIPIGLALDKTGGAEIIVDAILNLIGNAPVWVILLSLMITTMLLSNILNNVATAILMAPLGILMAQNLGVSIDPFLMAIAISASAPFLTPIGHQSNTLVMSQGGYKFKDYWRLGLPLSIIVLAVSIPLILRFWPL